MKKCLIITILLISMGYGQKDSLPTYSHYWGHSLIGALVGGFVLSNTTLLIYRNQLKEDKIDNWDEWTLRLVPTYIAVGSIGGSVYWARNKYTVLGWTFAYNAASIYLMDRQSFTSRILFPLTIVPVTSYLAYRVDRHMEKKKIKQKVVALPILGKMNRIYLAGVVLKF